jgi:hypothetical protein
MGQSEKREIMIKNGADEEPTLAPHLHGFSIILSLCSDCPIDVIGTKLTTSASEPDKPN